MISPVFMRLITAILLVTVLAVDAFSAGTSGPNMLKNTLLEADAGGSVTGWQHPPNLFTVTPIKTDAGPALKLDALTRVVFAQPIEAQAGKDYIASMWVKSKDRLVMTFGPSRASYHAQGQWQQVVGLVNGGGGGPLKFEFEVRSLTSDGATEFLLRDISIREAVHPGTPQPRKRFDTTQLVSNAKPAATIIANDSPAMQALAKQVQAAVHEQTGTTLPIVIDTDATGDTPALRKEFAAQHLILLGRLGTNRALWTAYNRFLSAADGYYPGGDGHVVRTASNVMRNGKNHLVLGGSTDAGVEHAVKQFIEIVKQTKSQGGSFELPWLLDVELGGECLASFKKTDHMWTTDPLNSFLPPEQPGYGTVRRWYENAMGYYWSGWPSYEERARDLANPLLEDMAYTHHYLGEFLVRTYDMVDDTPLLSDEQRVKMDSLMIKNFWEMTSGPDANWMTTFSPPYDGIAMTNRHQISPWTMDLKQADFINDYFDPQGDLGAAVKFRLSEKKGLLDDMVTNRWGPSSPGAPYVEMIDEGMVAMARYALDHDRYVFFESGNAHRAVFLDRLDARTGLHVRPTGPTDHHLLLGMLAHYHQDGRYKSLRENVPLVVHSKGHFQGRSPNNVHRWTPGPEIETQVPDTFTGVRIPPLMDHFKGHFYKMGRNTHYVPKDLDADKVLNLAAFRGGFGKDDDFFVLNGINEASPPGTILNFTSRGVYWLGNLGAGGFSKGSSRYLNQNAMHVLPTSRWMSEDDQYPALAMQDWSADLYRGGGVGVTLSPFMDTTWQREVVWVGSGLFLVRDQLEALQDGTFDVALSWRPIGVLSWDGKVLNSQSGGGKLQLFPLSADLTVRQNIDAYKAGEESEANFQLARSGPMKKGERFSAITVLRARDGSEAAIDAKLADANTVIVEDGDQPTAISFGPRDDKTLNTDAKAVVIGDGRLDVIGATRLSINGQSLLKSASPVSFAIDLSKKSLRADRFGEADAVSAAITLPGWSVEASEGDVFALKSTGQGGDALTSLLNSAAASLASHELPSRNDAAGQISIADASSQWQQQWSYDGLLRPAMIKHTRNVSDGVLDFGRVISLDEIRAAHTRGPYKPAPLPESFAVAVPDASGQMPALGSDGWKTIKLDPQWMPSIRSGNYGEAHPDDKVYQLAKIDGVEARWVLATSEHTLRYYDRSRQEARRSMLVEVKDLDGSGEPEVLVKPNIWPKFIRWRTLEDDMFTVLNADGSERFQSEARTAYQDVVALDYLGQDAKQIATLEVNGKIAIVDADGKKLREFDLWELHQEFHNKYGSDNTRQPAGGFIMPYAIGAWRPGADGVQSLIVARYGGMSFIDSKGKLEGVNMPGGYVTPQMLPNGVDFDGDGQQEQLIMAKSMLLVQGEFDERVLQPNGSFYYPQVYHVDRLSEPAWDPGVDGSPMRLMEVLPWANLQRAMLIARENYLGVFDGKSHRWMFAWKPLTRIQAAAVVGKSKNTLTALAATDDGLLWQLHWAKKLDSLASFKTLPLPMTVRGIAAAGEGKAALATDDGLLLIDLETHAIQRIATGGFDSVESLTEDGNSLVAVTQRGEVVRYDTQGR